MMDKAMIEGSVEAQRGGEVNPTGELKGVKSSQVKRVALTRFGAGGWRGGGVGGRMEEEVLLYQNKEINQERRKHRNQET